MSTTTITARQERTKSNREFLDRAKVSAGCIDCGYNDRPEALQFDHRPGTVKVFRLSSSVTRSREAIVAEMAKCDVRCANCHAAITKQRGYPTTRRRSFARSNAVAVLRAVVDDSDIERMRRGVVDALDVLSGS